MKRWLMPLVLITLSAWIGGCEREEQGAPEGAPAEESPTTPSAAPAEAEAPADFAPPEMDVSALPMALQTKIGDARYQVRRHPGDPEKIGVLGMLYYVHGTPAHAVDCFKRCTELAPDVSPWWYYLARAAEKAGDAHQAAAAYEKALALIDNYHAARLRLAALLMQKDPRRAAQYLQDVLAAAPNSPAAHYGLGRIAQAAGRLDEAGEHFSTALKYQPGYGAAHSAWADVLRRQGKTEEAARHERRGSDDVRLVPLADPWEEGLLEKGLDVETLVSVVVALVQRRDIRRGESLLQIALSIDPDNVAAQNAHASLLLVQGHTAEAAAEFRKIVAANPEFELAKSNLAMALVGLEEYAEAEQLLREVLAKHPENLVALERFCILMNRQEKSDEARAMVEETLAAYPDDVTLRYGVAELLFRLQQDDQARAVLDELLKLRPDHAPGHYLLGGIHERGGDAAAAKREWNAAIEADPDYLPARQALLTKAMRTKDYTAAERHLRAALRQNLDPAETAVLANVLAWILATSKDPQQRNAEEAVKWAEEACELTRYARFAFLDTLAAAYAEAGRFEDARKWIAEAIRLARTAQRTELVTEYEARQKLYAADQPYRESE